MSTDREIVGRVIERKEEGVVPFHVDFVPAVAERLRGALGAEDLDEELGSSVRWLHMDRPRERFPDGRWRDEFGVVWSHEYPDRGAVVEPALPEPSISDLELPEYDYSETLAHLEEECAAHRHRYLVCWIGDLLERAQFLRGTEGILADLLLNPRFAHELLEKLSELVVRNARAIARYDVDALFLSDDYGSQKSLLISPATWREFLRPRLKMIADEVHGLGKKFFLHSCGDITEIIPDLIEVGVDVLHPVQPEAMDIERVKAKYGPEMVFYGGVGTQHVMARSGRAGVRKEVTRALRILGRGGGYILAPGITLQGDCPVENVLEFVALAREARQGKRRPRCS